ncbi:MAG: flagellar export protein FliJ [Lachnospiraceae bacterium]|nr:flagellar export protein FliJ [Lachnospiraceae bacterium]MDD5854155.1 flagellar export protein FliJ [Lachnospiraceae bacterium]
MARFRYRMQNILDIKEKMETQAKNEFAQAQARLNAEEEKLADRVSYRQKLQEDGGRLLLADRLDILKIDENKKMVSYAGEQVRAQTIQVRMAQKKLDEQRVRMQKAMQERKTHEILKEKAFDDFKVELKAAEGKEIDELTSYTYGQKSRDNG